jgi:hypothetical protein
VVKYKQYTDFEYFSITRGHAGRGSVPTNQCKNWKASQPLSLVHIQLFQLRLSTSKAEKSNTSAKGCWESLWKVINLLAISSGHSTFPLCSWTTLIEIAVYLQYVGRPLSLAVQPKIIHKRMYASTAVLNNEGGFPFSAKCRMIAFFWNVCSQLQLMRFVPLDCLYFKRKRSQKSIAQYFALNRNPPLLVL